LQCPICSSTTVGAFCSFQVCERCDPDKSHNSLLAAGGPYPEPCSVMSCACDKQGIETSGSYLMTLSMLLLQRMRRPPAHC